ncbi:hypothetical protein [Streptomyces sp. NPDC001678]|uniref:hypothetical protein n=1 Tax=Streptomyces sp. NPDC001678 TaxID=3364599 RepID=UPI0036C5DD47
MSDLPVPDLDDLRFQPLVDAAKRALPQRAPEWTDHNVSDPGITLVEACAERTDQLLYRVNRMTDRQRSAVLRLMGITPLPASPARITVLFTRTDDMAVRRVIPAGTELRTEGGEEPVVLTTTAPLTLAEHQATGMVEAVEQLVTVTEVLGVSDGLPGGRFATRHRPWGSRTPVADPRFGPQLTVRVDREIWPAVRTFAEAGPDSRVHWWDDVSCEVVFGPEVPTGDGRSERRGSTPPKGASVSAEYEVFRGRKGDVSAGTPLTPASLPGLSATVHAVLAPAEDAEDWRQALERAGLGLAPLRRAVTAADHEQIIAEHVAGLARVRVTALTRPTDSRVPDALVVPQRPAAVLACAVAARSPQRVVHYYDDNGVITPVPLALGGGPSGQHDDAVPPPVAEAKRLDAVVLTEEGKPRLWFYGDKCVWDSEPPWQPKDIKAEFPGLPEAFASDLDEVAMLPIPGTPDPAYELFLFKGETFHHRTYTYSDHDRAFTPQEGSRGVTSLIPEAFPGLSPQCQRSPDAVAVVGGVFFFMKGTRTEPALWRREDDPLRVLLVPRVEGDPEEAPPHGAFDIPPDVLDSVKGVVDASRLLGERLRIGPPRYHRFGITATVRPWSSMPADLERTERAAERALRRFFHPTAGGPDGRGWPWGRRVHAGDVFTVLEAVPEVRATVAVDLTDLEDGGNVPSLEVSDGGLVRLDSVTIHVDTTEG